MIRAVIFDLDNTLVDFMSLKEKAIISAAEAMMDAGLKMTKTEIVARIKSIYDQYGFEYQRVFDILMEEIYGAINHKILASGIVAYRQAREAALVAYPHVHYTLIELVKKGYRLAVVSDAPAREAWLRLCYLKLHHTFDAVITHEDTYQYKPHPAPFQKALSILGLRPEEAIMVGDWAERDVAGARQLGMRTVFARYGDVFNTRHAGADYEINDIIELLDIMDKENALS